MYRISRIATTISCAIGLSAAVPTWHAPQWPVVARADALLVPWAAPWHGVALPAALGNAAPGNAAPRWAAPWIAPPWIAEPAIAERGIAERGIAEPGVARREPPELVGQQHVALAGQAGAGAGAAPGEPRRDAETAAPQVRGWKKGVGWGWIWGPEDELGALNGLTDGTRQAALRLATTGRTYDLGLTYSRSSFKWPGHNPGEIITFRSPEGVKRQRDVAAAASEQNRAQVGWHSCALFISDNVGTQIDGLGHITAGADNHWYNGHTEQQAGGDFGIRKCDIAKIPPIIARGVMLDIAGLKGVEALPPSYAITPTDVDRALARQKVQLRPGDVVLFRTGTARYWGQDGADVERLKEVDTAGINLDTAQYLVRQFGPVLIGSDTSGLEVNPAPKDADSFIPVHKYLLIEQGVYIGELHNLEELAKDKVYEFCYLCSVNKIAGPVAGFTLRPVAIR
jgi:kynurenine formamidase